MSSLRFRIPKKPPRPSNPLGFAGVVVAAFDVEVVEVGFAVVAKKVAVEDREVVGNEPRKMSFCGPSVRRRLVVFKERENATCL